MGRQAYIASRIALVGILGFAACSGASHPDIVKQPKEALNFVYAHCQNGARLRELHDADQADEGISDATKAAEDRLQLDRQLIICSESSTDPWVVQVTKLMSLGDDSIDKNACIDEKKTIDDDSRSGLDINSDLAAYYYCQAASADTRLKAVQEIGRSSKFDDIRAFSKLWTNAISQDVNTDDNMAERVLKSKF